MSLKIGTNDSLTSDMKLGSIYMLPNGTSLKLSHYMFSVCLTLYF